MLLRTNRNSTPLAADPTAAVLIADPHAIVADLLARHLRPYYRVFAPISRFGFVPDAIRLGRPVLAVLEMEFGDQSVIPFVREVRRCAGAPMILILSARASELDREVARLAGAEEVVSKRDGLTSLIGAIGLALRRLSVAAISDTPQQLDRVLASHSRGGQATVHRDVLWLLCSGFSYREIATKIGRTEKDVQYHASIWRRRLGVNGLRGRLDWTDLSFAESMQLATQQRI